jgi:site-specific recombinase
MVRGPELVHLLEGLDPDASMAQRHLWLIGLLRWVRGDGSNAATSVARVRLLLDAVQARPEWQSRWRAWWERFNARVDLAPLLADHGFSPRTAFLSELGHRLRKKLLPGTPETTDLGVLFDLLMPDAADVQWLRALDRETLHRLNHLLFGGNEPGRPGAPGLWEQALLDALVYGVGQVSATGFAAEIRVRMSDQAKTARSFHQLPVQLEGLREAVLAHGARSTQAVEAATALRALLDACRHAAYTVYAHLDAHGVSVGIVFRLRELRERVLRIKSLLDCLQSAEPEKATARLLADLAQVGQDNRSVRALIASSAHLTAAKVAERSAETGEHYITRNAVEYRAMLRKAAGGGALIGLTTWVKFALYGLGLSVFWGGLAAGLNYAFFFVLVQLMHLTVATKQPAVTAPAMAAKLRDIRRPGAVRGFVDEVAHLLRSQIAAILGNVGMVIPVVALISALLSATQGAPMVTDEQARHVLADMDLRGPTVVFAAFTGVLLFASSIIAGWVENWFVFHQLDSAMRHNPACTGWLGVRRADRWASFMRANVSGLAANVSLGLLLGVVPAFAEFFGLGLQVRHVTLSAGQVAAAAMALGSDVWSLPAFWWAVSGVVVVGPLNLAVSFYLAYHLALRAQNTTDSHRRRIVAALWQRLRQAPLSFLLPPPAGPDTSAGAPKGGANGSEGPGADGRG